MIESVLNKPEFLYHGSVTPDIHILEPRKRHTPDARIEFEAIYATSLPAYAAAHAFPWTSDEGIELNIINGKVTMIVPDEFKTRLTVPISIYKIASDMFEHTKEEETGYTWHTKQPVEVIEEKKYQSVISAIEELGGTLHFK